MVRHQQGEKPSTYLVLSIIVTILCCLPFGIIGIIYASKVDSCWNAGNFDEARENSRKAKTWALVGLVLGFVTYLIYILLIFLGVLDFWGYDDYLYMSCLS